MPKISRAQVFESLTTCVTPESADHLFQLALQATGLKDQGQYTPDEVLALSHAMIDLAVQQAQEAEQEAVYAELFGNRSTSS